MSVRPWKTRLRDPQKIFIVKDTGVAECVPGFSTPISATSLEIRNVMLQKIYRLIASSHGLILILIGAQERAYLQHHPQKKASLKTGNVITKKRKETTTKRDL